MRHRFLKHVVSAFAVALAALPSGATAEPPKHRIVSTARVPDGGFQPQAAADAKGTIHLIYFTGEAMHGDVEYVRSGDGGETFSKPIRVNSQEGSVVATGTVRGAHMALGKGGRVHVAWMGSGKAAPKAGHKSSPMLYTRLNDAGDAFEPQRNLIQKRPGLDGGGSVAADERGNVYVAWHAPKDGEGEENRHVWVTRSKDDGRTFGPEVAANPKPTGVCACCGMRIFASDGGVHILYRGATKTVNRDMHLLSSRDNAQTFEIAKVHPWKVGKCVMSTASFGSGAADTLAAWETREQIYFAKVSQNSSTAAAESHAPGDGPNRKHPSVAAGRDGRFVVAWTEGTGWNKGGKVRWQLFASDGTPEGEAGEAGGLSAWGVPAALALPDGSFRVIF